MGKATAKIKEEFLKMLPPTIFFFVALNLVLLIRALLTRGTGLSLPTFATVIISALILGKAVLLANMLPFINRFPEKPLIWNAAWKTVIYTIVATFIHFLERLHEFWKETHDIGTANHQLLTETNWAHFVAIEILLLVLIFNYCVFAELGRVIGPTRLKAMFLGPMSAATSAASEAAR
ncbi:hypothetical protein [Dyella telluris]|uniref:Uncharacterized protein n=1 Tax=Dyella telluris TaxID=2763498 RepID=A0A7G8Q5I1_9GAMM|nr:hypothetical protein [Dyella telluris]QNK02039.1 hypothetical protein H8F01_02420 [Dyella telluris]